MRLADVFTGNDHNAFMMLGLLNTLTNAGILPEKERDDIIKLGEMIKGSAEAREDDEKIKAARAIAGQLKRLGGSYYG